MAGAVHERDVPQKLHALVLEPGHFAERGVLLAAPVRPASSTQTFERTRKLMKFSNLQQVLNTEL